MANQLAIQAPLYIYINIGIDYFVNSITVPVAIQ